MNHMNPSFTRQNQGVWEREQEQHKTRTAIPPKVTTIKVSKKEGVDK